jgi:hypothetical protein
MCFYVTDMKYTILLRQPQVQDSSYLKGVRETEELGFSLRDKGNATNLCACGPQPAGNLLKFMCWPFGMT